MAGDKIFAIDRRIWSKVCALNDINVQTAFLIVCRGSDETNRYSSWSAQSVKNYAGIGVERATQAIQTLLQAQILAYTANSTRVHPRYEILPFGRKQEPADEHIIWLPNSLVDGAGDEIAPVRRLRSTGDSWAMRLFVDLYFHHNLRDDGGVKSYFLWKEFNCSLVAHQGIFGVLAYSQSSTRRIRASIGPFEAHDKRDEIDGVKAVWKSLDILCRLGLLDFVPHLFENSTPLAEILLPLGCGGKTEHELETEIGKYAEEAGRAMGAWHIMEAEKEHFEHFCPVLRDYPNAEVRGVARLLYRPHTLRTVAWNAHLHEISEEWLPRFRELVRKAQAILK